MKQAFQLGLTGGIGSGKSTVSQMLAERGAATIDADAIARSMTAPHGPAMSAIAQTFGTEFVTPDGALNRERMRELVFAQPSARQQLEAIVHPLVAQATARAAAAAQAQGHELLVFDVPLLVESGRWRQQVDAVLVVDCLPETQIQRVMTRSGLSRNTVMQIMSAQASRLQRLAAADWVIFNDGLSMQQLHIQVCELTLSTGS